MEGFYEGEELVTMYETFRPTYPVELVSEVLKFLDEQNPEKKRRGFMLDVGCGGGQATRLFAPHFEKVLGIDPSVSQVGIGKKNVPEAEFLVGSASKLPVESESVDLVIAGSAVHYFDLDAFVAECNRALLPGGCVALFCYLPIVLKTPEGSIVEGSNGDFGITNHLMRYADAIGVSDYAVNLVEQYYQPLYDRINKKCKKRVRGIELDIQYTVEKYVGFLETLGEYRLNTKSFGDKDPLEIFENKLKKLLGLTDDDRSKETSFTVTFEYPVVLFRK